MTVRVRSTDLACKSIALLFERCPRSPERPYAGRSATNERHPVQAVTVFSAADRPVEPLSFGFGQDLGHAHDGGAHNWRIAAKMKGA